MEEMETITKNYRWRKRRIALAILFTIIGTIVGVIIGKLLFSPNNGATKAKGADYLCLTPGCIHSASKALELMDPNVDPCDDFYKYACGKFERETNIPDDKTSVRTFSFIGDRLQEQLLSLVTDEIKDEEATPFKLAKHLFKLCMNKTRIEERGIQPLQDILESLGGWPVLKGDQWNNDSTWSWVKSVKDFRKYGFRTSYFLRFWVDVDLKNSSRRMIYIDQSYLGIDREYLVNGIETPFDPGIPLSS